MSGHVRKLLYQESQLQSTSKRTTPLVEPGLSGALVDAQAPCLGGFGCKPHGGRSFDKAGMGEHISQCVLTLLGSSMFQFRPANLSHRSCALLPATRHLAAGFRSLDFKEVQMGEKLGSGAGATVYQGQWQGRTEGGSRRSEKLATFRVTLLCEATQQFLIAF